MASKIQGEVSDVLKNFCTSVQELDLSSNKLTGKLPNWLGSFTRLDLLKPLTTHLFQKSPAPSQTWKSLECSIFTRISSGNRLSSGIEQIIQIGAGLIILYHLNVSHNSITGQIPTFIGELGSLQTLDLSYNKLGSVLPVSQANISSLEILRLERNQITGNIPSEYLKFENVKELDLSNNLLVREIPFGKPLK